MLSFIVLLDQQEEVEVKEGAESVILPCRTTPDLPEDATVEWTRSEPKVIFVHVFPNTNNPNKQSDLYISRTEMDKDLLRTGDLSLTLKYPTDRDSGSYICTVYRHQDILRDKVVLTHVKGQSVNTGQRSGEHFTIKFTEALIGKAENEIRSGVVVADSHPHLLLPDNRSQKVFVSKAGGEMFSLKKCSAFNISCRWRGVVEKALSPELRGSTVLCFSTEGFPAWATALLVLLFVVLPVSGGVLFYFRHYFMSGESL
uniref:Ig-like domain-containing protein n=1 Tax=Kryptolebias marmoratus TaxID=37003 RepID=A0A3Q3A386_KRYMA